MYKNKYFWLAISWTVVVTVMSLMNSNDVPSVKIPNLDKVVHLIFYFFLTIIWYLCFKGNNLDKLNKIVLVISCMVAIFYGVVMEISQALFTINRSADIKDAIANTVGSILGVVLIIIYYRLKKVKYN